MGTTGLVELILFHRVFSTNSLVHFNIVQTDDPAILFKAGLWTYVISWGEVRINETLAADSSK
ncbi:2350_t:CDS:2 [Paraglomus brasilianum]|uniref:2350_t:CDS:1 n=1 Tax=Paraglomus brasilianum TaxID=144538 RepID=A0A9N9GKT7_9GLOM|nr:2350_t:CDS:2 [Paraglomus brasilianum]